MYQCLRVIKILVLLGCFLFNLNQKVEASSGMWTITASGDWTTTTRWNTVPPGSIPDGAGDVAAFITLFPANSSINLVTNSQGAANITIGSLILDAFESLLFKSTPTTGTQKASLTFEGSTAKPTGTIFVSGGTGTVTGNPINYLMDRRYQA